MSTSLDMNQVLELDHGVAQVIAQLPSVNIWLVTPDGQALEIAVAAGCRSNGEEPPGSSWAKASPAR